MQGMCVPTEMQCVEQQRSYDSYDVPSKQWFCMHPKEHSHGKSVNRCTPSDWGGCPHGFEVKL